MIAFVFPGQGSQKLNMLQDFYHEAIVQETFQEASDVLGFDLLNLIRHDEVKLNQTEFTQPAILAASVALYRLWFQQTNAKPDYLAGHSLGEYSALVVAEVLQFQDAVSLVHLRGQLMQEAVPAGKGAMAVILGLDDRGVIEACAEAAQGGIVSAANFNAPGQVVIAGDALAVSRAMETAKVMGAKRVLPLAVSVPSHCMLMHAAAEKFADHFASISCKVPTIKVIHNVDAALHTESASIQEALIKQLDHPVLWVKSMQVLEALGVNVFVECGPGKVLTGLNKRIIAEGQFFNLEDQAGFVEGSGAAWTKK
jgi:[acyl-carrier-protein] S-malonyltransferase